MTLFHYFLLITISDAVAPENLNICANKGWEVELPYSMGGGGVCQLLTQLRKHMFADNSQIVGVYKTLLFNRATGLSGITGSNESNGSKRPAECNRATG